MTASCGPSSKQDTGVRAIQQTATASLTSPSKKDGRSSSSSSTARASHSAAAKITTPPAHIPISKLKIGNYIQFGWYGGEPLLWRVIEDSTNPAAREGAMVSGDPLLFSDRVISKKAYDATGNHGDTIERINKGSNLWQTSNIRALLNSSAKAGAIKWPCGNPPTKGNVSSNAYADEKGFLANGNFTAKERALIKPVAQKTLLYVLDQNLAEGGSASYKYDKDISAIINNYNEAWYHTITDKVFLLDPKQINSVYKRFGWYYNTHQEDYWLRAPDIQIYTDSSPSNILYIRGQDGVVMYADVNSGHIGVRPALVLDRKSVLFRAGNGSETTPYILAQ